MRVCILAGGFGTRLAEETAERPKPMVEIGGLPILWHIMRIFAAYGHTEFVLALGYRAAIIKQFFLNCHLLENDVSIDLRTGAATVYTDRQPDWRVHMVDTGQHTRTGGRIKRLRAWLDHEPFLLTYGDGLADIDLDALLAFHRGHGRLATVTAVRPPARFGGFAFHGDRVVSFCEKPHGGDSWINGGFFVLQPEVIDYIDSDATSWEREPLEKLATAGELMAYRHEGFFQPMDTLHEKRQLEALWASGDAPWQVRERAAMPA